MEVEAEAREERLPLGQVLESCKLESGRRCVEIQTKGVVAVDFYGEKDKPRRTKLSAREKLMGKQGEEWVGACQAAPLRKQSHKEGEPRR